MNLSKRSEDKELFPGTTVKENTPMEILNNDFLIISFIFN